MTKLKLLRRRLDQMTDHTYALLRGALLLSLTMALCAVALFLIGGGPTIAGFDMYKIARELISLGAVTLFVASIASVIVEDFTAKK